jgi:glycosyltransferase involved in cell wall biosynthesis
LKTLKSLIEIPTDISRLAVREEVRAADIIQAVGGHHPHGAFLAAKLRKPLVWQLHSSILPKLARRAVAPLISAKADAIMTNGYRVAEAFWGSPPIKPNHHVFFAPIDSRRFQPNESARFASRASFGFLDTDVVVGTVGNRVWQKNHEMLIQIASQMAGQFPNLRFCILGAKSADYAKTYAETVERPAANLNKKFPGYINFLEPGQCVDHWIHALDIFVLTSHAEGIPIALFEAMAAGKPVVSVQVGSINEIVQEERTGFLCPPSDPVEIQRSLGKLITSEELRRRFGTSAIQRIENEFSLSHVTQAHISAYEAAIEHYKAR